MSEKKQGSGVIAMDVYSALFKRNAEQFEASLKQLGFKKKQVADMVAGYKDGQRSMFLSLQEMEVVIGVQVPETVPAPNATETENG